MDVTIIKVYFKFRWLQNKEIKIQVHVIEKNANFFVCEPIFLQFQNSVRGNKFYHESIKHLEDRKRGKNRREVA